jgi:hypothetical protein
VKDFLTKFLNGSLLLTTEKLLNKAFPVNVKDILVLFVLFKKLLWADDVLSKHLLDFLHGINYPWEILCDGKVGLLLLLDERHKAFFEVADLVGGGHDQFKCALVEI